MKGIRHGRKVVSRLWAVPVFALFFLLVVAAVGWQRVQDQVSRLRALFFQVDLEVEELNSNARLVLGTLAAYRHSSEAPDRRGIVTLSRIALRQNHYLRSVVYYRWVPDGGASGDAIELAGRRGHLVAEIVEPEGPLASGWVAGPGHGLPGAARDRDRLEHAVTFAQPVALHGFGPLRPGTHALAWAQAVYHAGRVPETAAERRAAFEGLFLVVADVGRLVAEWRRHHPAYRVSLVDGPPHGDADVDVGWALRPSLSRPLVMWHRARLSSGDLLALESRLALHQILTPRTLVTATVVGLLACVSFLLWRSQRLQRLVAARARRALDRERERAQKTLHAIGDAVLVVDDTWRVRYVNPTGSRLLGLPEEEIRGRPLDAVVSLREACSGRPVEDLRRHFLSQSAEGECGAVQLIDAAGRPVAIDSRVSPLVFPDGNDGMVIVMRDVSREQKLMEKLAYQASHDALTGLYNRSAFESAVGRLLEEETDAEHAIIYLDLDRFKLINDTCGHAAGDELLRRISGQLHEVVRRGDQLARVGGDEFAILLRECSLEVAEGIARRILASIDVLRFHWEDKVFQVHASIGVVALQAGRNSLKQVLMDADLACHVAKERGRNRIHVHRGEDTSIHRHHQEMQWLPRLHQALDSDRFELFLQPIRPLGEGEGLPVMHEFLLRLRNADGRLLPPGLFIPAAERYDLMWQIDRWVVENAIGHLAKVKGDTGDLYTINLSAQTFSDRSFADFVEMTLESYGVDAGRICFELTETAAVTNIAVAGELMQALKDLGCRILLDDFGSGLSSFGYLKRLPIDYLKIDGQFVCDLLTDPLDEVMVRMCVELARVLEVRTVAEFIESAEILEAARAIGVDYGQGYHLGRPQRAAQGDPERAAG